MYLADPMTLLITSYVVPAAALAYGAWAFYLAGASHRDEARVRVEPRRGGAHEARPRR
jgi:hypothetical protein